MRNGKQQHGFMFADVLIALAVVAVLATALTVGITRQARGSKQLADERAATRLADATVLSLQTGLPAPAAPQDMKISVDRANGGGDLPAGCAWATVQVTRGSYVAELTGIVRAEALKGATP